MPDGEADEMDAGTSVEAILRAFNAPINEEQAWALCFQTVKHVTHPFPASLTTDDLFIAKDGTVSVRSSGAGNDTSEKDFLYSLGRLLYAALDYGLRQSEERILEPNLEAFIVKLTTKEDEGSCDEGIENDEEDSSSSSAQLPLTRESVLQICSVRLSPKIQPDMHFKAVCRAFYVEYEELSAFLTQVSRGTTELRKSYWEGRHSGRREQLNVTVELENLKSADWARLWMQVIRQLRNGVKLRKVESDGPFSRSEFELTPYEMLLNDIRLRRYKLKHVAPSDDVLHQVKKDAHDVILEFIRSRPPLVPVSRRPVPPTPPKNETVYEKLMKSIRQEHRLRPLPNECRRQDHSSSRLVGRVLTDLPVTQSLSIPTSSSTSSPRRRQIKADLDLSLIGSDDDDDDFHSLKTKNPHHQVPENGSNQGNNREIIACRSPELTTPVIRESNKTIRTRLQHIFAAISSLHLKCMAHPSLF